MSGRVDNINFNAFIHNGGILGQDCDTTLFLDIVGVHDALRHFLILPENTALFQQFVYQSRFAMIDVRDDCYISYIFSCLCHNLLCLSYFGFANLL